MWKEKEEEQGEVEGETERKPKKAAEVGGEKQGSCSCRQRRNARNERFLFMNFKANSAFQSRHSH